MARLGMHLQGQGDDSKVDGLHAGRWLQAFEAALAAPDSGLDSWLDS